MRNTCFRTIHALMREDPRVCLLVGDIGYRQFDPILADFPARVVNVGVAEANLMGLAAGMALAGKVPFVYSIATFATYRCFEQIRVDLCYHDVPVKILGGAGGFVFGAQGPTHHAVEELGVLRNLPNMTVFCPADPQDVSRVVRASMTLRGPAYIRLGRNNEPNVTGMSEAFRIGEGAVLREGRDVSLLGCGRLMANVLKAADVLAAEGIAARVVNVATLKPIDRAMVLRCARETGGILTVEEHSVLGGLGSAVAEVLAEGGEVPVRFRRLGTPDAFCRLHAEHRELEEHFGLDGAGIARAARDLLGSGGGRPGRA